MQKGFVEELRWRGMLGFITPNAEEVLNDGKMHVAYCGTDPTFKSLHLGHCAAFMLLRLFQKYGGKPIVLVGGATAMIGDPSFKSSERNAMSRDVVKSNTESIKKQLMKLVDFESDAPNKAIMVDNYDWVEQMSLVDFMQNVGKYITVNYMMAKESVKKRLDREGEGISFTEFSYQLLQAYDHKHLYENYGCDFQFSGLDQIGNATTGLSLISKTLDGAEANFIACPLITDANGKKIGKTDGNASVWLDRELTSPYKMYQYFLNVSDELAEKMIKFFTLLDKETIEELIEKHKELPHLRILQKKLGEEVVTMIHSKEDCETAIKASAALFDKTIDSLKELDEQTFNDVFEGVTKFDVDKHELEVGINIVELLASKTQILDSKGNARKAITNNSISVNKVKVSSPNELIHCEHLINDKYILIQNGKKNMYLICVQ